MIIKTEIIYANEFDDDVYLNIENLGAYILMQPKLIKKYSIYVSDLTDERDNLRGKIKYKKEMLGLEIKDDPSQYGISYKLTEKTVESLINTDKDIYTLKKDLLYLNKLVTEANGALTSVRDKGFAIKSAVELFKTGYWGELTGIPSDMQALMDAHFSKKDMDNNLESNKRMINQAKKENENG